MTASRSVPAPIRRPTSLRRTRLRHLVWFVAISLVLSAAGCGTIWIATTPRAAPGGGSPASAATTVAAASIDAQGGPDAVVAAFDHGSITEFEAVGDAGLTADTPFYVGSLSKTFTAAVAARLIDAGRLTLDAPVPDYLPTFRIRGEHSAITIRHLLNQTTGVPTGACMTDLITPEATLAERVDELADTEPVSEPGTTFHYCNKNFAALALVIESVTGTSYREALTELLIDPLELEHTFVDPPATRDVTAGHLPLFGAQLPASTPFYPGALADGYVISSARDLATFADVLATGIHGDTRFLSATVLDQMHTAPEHVAADPDYGSTYGLGLRLIDVQGAPMIWHEGELATAHANLGVFPQSRTGLVVLTNQNGQLYSGDAPFQAGVERLAGATGSPVDDGGFRTVAMIMTVIASLTIAAIVVDVMRWSTILRRARRGRLARNVLPRVLVALALSAAVLFGVGSMLGLGGAVPIPLLWTGAPDLTAIATVAVGYLALSAVVLALLPERRPRAESTA